MIKEALKYICEQAIKAEAVQTIEIAGRTYCNKGNLTCYDDEPVASPINATTLTALVDYINTKRDELRDSMIIHIHNATTVSLYSGLLGRRDRGRETLFVAKAKLPEFSFNSSYDQESFVTALQSCFEDRGDRTAIALAASNIVNGPSAEYTDDGVSQAATIKTGVTTKERQLIPNPVELTPYRTFLEVDQTASPFIFRIGEANGVPTFKLVEADGGRWKIEAMQKIKEYLAEALPDAAERGITILA